MDNPILDVVLGLVLVYLVLALLVMKLQEVLAGQLMVGRPKYLHKLVKEATGHDENLKQRIFDNALVFGLSMGDQPASEQRGKMARSTGPSEIPPALFARALLIELHDDHKGGHPADFYASPTAFVAEKSVAGGGTAARTWRSLRGLLAGREGDWPGFEADIASWFKQLGDRSEGWYKRRSQNWSLGLAMLAAMAFNVDSFHIAERLSSDPQLRRSLASLAERVNAAFPGGVAAPAGTVAPANGTTAAAAASPARAAARVSAGLVDAITRLNTAFFTDTGLANFKLNQRELKETDDCTGLGVPFTKDKSMLTKDRTFLSNPGTWVLGLPQLLAFIEQQQVSDTPPKQNLQMAFKCLSHVSAWVRAASSATDVAAVRTLVQEAAVHLESAKAGLLELIDDQRPTYTMAALFKLDPERFNDCATAAGASFNSVQVCMARAASGQVRLPIGPFRDNLRQQFCTVRVPDETRPELRSGVSSVLCGETVFEGSDALRIKKMWLDTAGGWAFIFWFVGCLFTGLFVALGAPFWFDVLGKVVKLRAAGRKADEDEQRRAGQGNAPLPAPGQPAAAGAPFRLGRNSFEDLLLPADIVSVQRQLGIAGSGVLDAPTRSAIGAYTGQHGLAGGDELSFTVYDHLVGRSPSGVAGIRPANRPTLGQPSTQAQPLAKNLMAILGFEIPARIDPKETTITADLRALAVLYRYKREARAPGAGGVVPPQLRPVVTTASSNPKALNEIDEALIAEVLSYTGAAADRLPRDAAAPWLDWAIGELGQVEADKKTRAESNPRVLAYLDTVVSGSGKGGDNGDHTSWCAAFVAWVLTQHNLALPPPLVGPPASGSAAPLPACAAAPAGSAALLSQSYSRNATPAWGTVIAGVAAGSIGPNVQAGDVVTLKLGGSTTINHVALVVAVDGPPANPAGLWALGGNQSGGRCVCVSHFKASEVADIQRP